MQSFGLQSFLVILLNPCPAADIIYHLFDAFTKHNADILEAKRKDAVANAVWPCKLKILKTFCSRDPIIVGCDVSPARATCAVSWS